jgi:transcriptional regulator with XRE-family HTH domain
MNLVSLATKVRDLRYAKGWGPDELAVRAKISRTALYQIERGGTSKPQAATLKRISRALGVPLEVLLAAAPTSHESDEGATARFGDAATATSVSRAVPTRVASSDRADELIEKFRLLLASPLAEGVARIVEESFRLLPIIPASVVVNQPRYGASVEVEPLREGRNQPFKPA